MPPTITQMHMLIESGAEVRAKLDADLRRVNGTMRQLLELRARAAEHGEAISIDGDTFALLTEACEHAQELYKAVVS